MKAAAFLLAFVLVPTALASSTRPSATLAGKISLDGKAIARERISLYKGSNQTKSTLVARTRTDLRGRYVFRVYKARSYSIGFATVVAKADIPREAWPNPESAGGLWDMGIDKPCHLLSSKGLNVVNLPVYKKTTNEFIGYMISTAIGIKLGLGDHLTKNLAFKCT